VLRTKGLSICVDKIFPAGHEEQNESPDLEYDPVGQLVHGMVDVLVYWLSPHAPQNVESVVDPLGQKTQAVCPPTELTNTLKNVKYPGAHGTH